jgi:hypothetical protein
MVQDYGIGILLGDGLLLVFAIPRTVTLIGCHHSTSTGCVIKGSEPLQAFSYPIVP